VKLEVCEKVSKGLVGKLIPDEPSDNLFVKMALSPTLPPLFVVKVTSIVLPLRELPE